MQQQQCIDAYVVDVRTVFPNYDLSERRFGGVGGTTSPSPVLGAGFGTTATRSLAAFGRQLGLKVHHFSPSDPEHEIWYGLDWLLRQNCSARKQLNDVNFSQMLNSGSDMLLDTPMGELFLDFYAASPESKVILTVRDAQKWALARLAQHGSSALPLQSPCGGGTDRLQVEDAAKLFQWHLNLVRCMVPPEKLLEVNIFEEPKSSEIAHFLGVETDFYVPFPKVSFEWPQPDSIYSGKSSQAHATEKRERFPICITGQIRRLELQTKIKRLIQPAVDAGHLVEVYLVIDPRQDTSYIHRGAGERVGNYTIVEGAFHSLNETTHLFPSNVSVIYDPFIPQDYTIDPRYALGMRAISDSMRIARARAKSHVRQWEALTRCFDLFHIIHDHPPDIALRLREDMSVMEEFTLPPFKALSPGLHVPNCEEGHGLNDKVALAVGQGEVENYFTLPLKLMRNRFTQMLTVQGARTRRPLNPESVLLNTMMLSNTKVHADHYFPMYHMTVFQDASGQTNFCYFQSSKNSSSTAKCFSDKILKRLNTTGKPIYKDATSKKALYLCDVELTEEGEA